MGPARAGPAKGAQALATLQERARTMPGAGRTASSMCHLWVGKKAGAGRAAGGTGSDQLVGTSPPGRPAGRTLICPGVSIPRAPAPGLAGRWWEHLHGRNWRRAQREAAPALTASPAEREGCTVTWKRPRPRPSIPRTCCSFQTQRSWGRPCPRSASRPGNVRRRPVTPGPTGLRPPSQASHPPAARPARAPSSWPPGSPSRRGPLASQVSPSRSRRPSPGQHPGPVKSKHEHTTQTSASFLHTRPPSLPAAGAAAGASGGGGACPTADTLAPGAAAPWHSLPAPILTSWRVWGGRAAAQRPRSPPRPASRSHVPGLGGFGGTRGGCSDSYTGQRALRTIPSPPGWPQAGRSPSQAPTVRGAPLQIGRRAEPQGAQSSPEVKSPPRPTSPDQEVKDRQTQGPPRKTADH